MRSEELAREAYAAYGKATDNKNYLGLPMPSWEHLPPLLRVAWTKSVERIVELVTTDNA